MRLSPEKKYLPLTEAVMHYFNLFDVANPIAHFYPTGCGQWHRAYYNTTLAKGSALFNDSYAIHLWNEMGRRQGFDKNATFVKTH